MKTLLIFTDHFFPAFKGGGPIQSIVNMVRVLADDFSCMIVCSAHDLGETAILPEVKVNQWNEYSGTSKVFYRDSWNKSSQKKIIKSADADIVYINGLFSVDFNILPLLIVKRMRQRIIVAPRGMLQSGALAIRPLKKRVFLYLFRLMNMYRNVEWHATDGQERDDIRQWMGKESIVHMASNIPVVPPLMPVQKIKLAGQLKMIYLSLITEKKGLYLALEALSRINRPVVFDIYGPVKDTLYWECCLNLIEKLSRMHMIRYYGPVQPDNVLSTFSDYHVMVLPTMGENFGHAIYESLSAGTPVILSMHTPWGDLEKRNAGKTVDIKDKMELPRSLESFIDMDQIRYDSLSSGACSLAKDYFQKNNFKEQYKAMFSA